MNTEEGLFDYCHCEYKKRNGKRQRDPPFEATAEFWEWLTEAIRANASFGYIVLYFTRKLARVEVERRSISTFVCSGPFDPETRTTFQKELSKRFPKFDTSLTCVYIDDEYGLLDQTAFQIDWSTRN